MQTSPQRGQGNRGESTISIVDLDLSRYDRIASRFLEEARGDIAFLKSGIETQNAAFNERIELIERVAIRSSEPILLTGPAGAGKSRLARQIYELNCATLRGDAAMSTLFGHTQGAYTGAVQDRKGLLREADGGMIFLDEIGELGLDEQAMLLHAIEEKRFLSVGADQESESDFQIICGTNRDLLVQVAKGQFRDDLLARINLWTFRLPGLKDRPEDILPNINYELALNERSTGKRVSFNREALEAFLSFSHSPRGLWTSNFRDLKAAIVRMSTLANGARIGLPEVKAEIQRLSASWHTIEAPKRATESGVLEQTTGTIPSAGYGSDSAEIDEFDRCQLEHGLQFVAPVAAWPRQGEPCLQFRGSSVEA